MKNKKSTEQLKALNHKLFLAQAKARRRSEPQLERRKPILEEKPVMLIYCEGENTEPSYFNKFKIASLSVESFGEGHNTKSLVKRAIQLSSMKHYERIWCVFDADPIPGNKNRSRDFNESIKLAERNGFGVAYSNQAFEYWLLLHFEDHQGGKLERAQYGPRINSYINKFGVTYDYQGSKIVSQEFYNLLMQPDEKIKSQNGKRRVRLALRRAEKIFNMYDHLSPAREESSTTVFKLVKELLKYK